MFSQPTPTGFQDRYQFDISRHYKIWFSAHASKFLGIENELRVIRFLTKNPGFKLSLVYSPRCLDSIAQKQLKDFAARYQVQLCDFDHDVLPLLTDPKDIKLYDLAQTEITRFLNHTYGNLGSAADYARLLVPLIEKLGIYSDFDIEHSLATLGATAISINAPVLCHLNLVETPRGDRIIVSFNSDFIAFAYDNSNSAKLNSAAIKAIRNIQDRIISNHTQPFVFEKTIVGSDGIKMWEPLSKAFKKEHPHHATIFDFRKFFDSYNNPKISAHNNNLIRGGLERISVVEFSGPTLFKFMYKSLFPANTHDLPQAIPMNDEKWYPYLTLCRKSSIGYYDMVADRVATLNNVEGLTQKKFSTSDQAWTQSGLQAKTDRETQMTSAAISIQHFWRRKYDPHHMLYQRALKITSKTFLAYLNNKQYSLALRNASKNAQIKLVELILHYREALQININDPSSNNHTALDWANTITDEQKRAEMVKLLTQAGAVSGLKNLPITRNRK